MATTNNTPVTKRTTWSGSIRIDFNITCDPTWYPKGQVPSEEQIRTYIEEMMSNLIDSGSTYEYKADPDSFKISKVK